MNASKAIVRVLAATSAMFGLGASAFGQATFQGLGDLPGNSFSSDAFATSADGAVVVGVSRSASGIQAFRWTLAGGMVGLGDLPGGAFSSFARGISADGSVVVGSGFSASGNEAFRWTSAGGMVGLGGLPGGGFSSGATGTSADGSVVVGQGFNAASNAEAFRWTSAGGMVGLGDLPGGFFSSVAFATSADGAVVVGRSVSASGNEAFRWTSGGGMVGLGDLPDSIFQSSANGTSGDGSVVVGWSNSASGVEAFRWTSGDGMVGLGDLPGGNFDSRASAASADGSVVVGLGTTAAGLEAFLWTADDGMRSVQDLLVADFGLDLTGWQLRGASGISPDGMTIVGFGTNPDGFREGWITTIFDDCNANGIPDETEADTDADGVIDLCDICPGDPDNLCDPDGSTAEEVTAADGGTVETPNGDLALEIPANSLPGDTTVSVTATEPAANSTSNLRLATGDQGLGVTVVAEYDFQPDDLTFDPPAVLTLTLDVSNSPQGQLGNLAVYLFDDVTNEFVQIDDPNACTVDLTTLTATCTVTVDHFSTYAVIVPADTDNDGLPDLFPPFDEATLGTDPSNPDSDGDGMLDGTEVDTAMGSGCPNPLVADSDGDSLTDGQEVALGTSPCNPDTDGDGIPDNIDPLPLDPEGTSGFLEEEIRRLANDIRALDPAVFTGPNANANRGRRNALANRASAAANQVRRENFAEAINILNNLLSFADGQEPPPDWVADNDEQQPRSDIATRTALLITILEFLL